ncbi:nuclease-related domain-containing protein [Bacillus sp. REN16]|uniref:nuclease-related domain-containing protein n=1 Tax=Bacillus sp. REN16 TaxID=2887296 RepID=UPI001E54FDB9|nr:nuclease-related domain-containing protein [Bacillus sp. REN16]MCC3356139.1 NERD domain-containing protein [Bacillus sp. REN16]
MSLNNRKNKALRRRISAKHPIYEAVDEKYRLLNSGYNGEKSLDYYLKFFPEKKYYILNGLRLPDYSTNTYFEIDSFILSPNFILDVDAKNHKGELHFDHHFEQMHQTYEGRKKTYTCPLTQLYRHRLQLKRLLEANKMAVPSIESLVVITNPSTSITVSDYHPGAKNIIRAPSLISKMEQFEKMHKKVVLDNKQVQRLVKLLKKLHTPLNKDILQSFGIQGSELLKGVFCPVCDALPMKRSKRKWCCTNCGHTSTDAHLKAILDYFLLIDNTITNKKLREFLLLPSRITATNILLSLGLEKTGEKKGAKYHISVERLLEMCNDLD